MRSLGAPRIRPGGSADLPQIVRLLEAAGLPTADLPSAQGLQTWVIEGRGILLAAVGLECFENEGLLRSLVVVPEHREQGFGQALVARVERDARTAGITQLVLLTETAEPFFRTLGYGVIDRGVVSDGLKRSAEFQSLCPVSAVCMTKKV